MTQLKSSLKVDTKLEAFYTEGKIQIDKNGEYMFCGCGQKVQMINIKSSNLVASFSKEEENVTNFILSPDNKHLIVACQNLLLRQWNWREKKLVRSWRTTHRTPIVTMAMDTTSTLLATGSTDLTIKVWDTVQEHCTHDLTGHKGVICAMEFNPDKSRLQLVSASDDNLIRIWDLVTSTCISEVSAHYSTVTSLIFTPDGNTMYSTGRDSVVITWNMKELKVSKTLPVFERLESLIPVNSDILDYDKFKLKEDSTYYITAGNKGNLSIYQHDNGKCIYSKKLVTVDGGKSEDEQVIIQALYHPVLKQFIIVTYDHNIILVDTNDFTVQKQFAGYMDEVLDLQFIGKDDSHIIVVTNSEKIKVYERSSWKCQILTGHTDIVLNISVHKQSALFASSAKDSTIRVWKFDEDTSNIRCVAIASGHIQAVGAVCLAKTKAEFVISGSEDNTLKKWELPTIDDSTKDVVTLKALATDIAHEKDINFIDISPNDKFIATCSLDKTAKIWKESDLSLIGVMRGHRRGVWCIQFSPVDQCVLTGSADSTIKIWSLQDFSCVKTFEGHSASVLRTMFISNGMQILSSGADGVLKLWTIKTNECIKSYDDHSGKIWALTTNTVENTVVTGAADSTVIFWKDITEEEREETLKKQEDLILKEQQLSNLIQQKKYVKALSLAITLEQPYKVLTIIKAILKENEGVKELETTLSKLQMYQVDAILRFAVTWNTNSKHCQEAQFIIGVILKSFSPNQLTEFPNIQSTLEGLLPYTDRHFKRMNRLLQQSMFVEYTWTCMGRINDNPSQSIEAMEDSGTDFVISRKGTNTQNIDKNSDSESDGSDSESELDENSAVKSNTVNNTGKQQDSDSDSSSEESEMEVTDENKNSKLQNKDKITEKENSPIVHVTRSNKKMKLEHKPSLMRDSTAKSEIYKSPASVKRKTKLVK